VLKAFVLLPCEQLIESFWFEDDIEYEILNNLKFLRVFSKKDSPENFILLYFTKKVIISTVIYTLPIAK